LGLKPGGRVGECVATVEATAVPAAGPGDANESGEVAVGFRFEIVLAAVLEGDLDA
jgi:hypothetical protein